MMDFLIFSDLTSNEVHTLVELRDFIIQNKSKFARIKRGKITYYNIPVAFDIESSNFFQLIGNEPEPQKIATMYCWTISIAGYVVMGRTWYQYKSLIDMLVTALEITPNNRLVIYVHNLQFDFSFFRKWFEWSNVFSVKSRTPVYAVDSNGIEYRCAYLLSGYKLEKVAEHLQHFTIKKLVGDLDYKLIRHSYTPLSEEEIQYCINDVQIVIAYIAEQIMSNGTIADIPLTKTGYVRRYCRNNCFYTNGEESRNDAQTEKYKNIIRRMNVTEQEYYELKNGFQGGFTHANPFYIRKTVDNVASFDFNSCYPAVIVSEKFPMCSSELVEHMTKTEFEENLQKYCCLFEIELFDVISIVFYENYISRYRCRELVKPVCVNGRIVSAEHLKTTVTEQDYFIIRRFYRWDEKRMRISNFRRYKRGYLPTDFIKSVLKLYSDKTELKGQEGKEAEYLHSKEMLNSCYGMMVTDIVRDEIEYINNMWPNEYGERAESTPKNTQAKIIKYNKNQNRFLFYPWGVWVTAYARRNLFTGIMEFGPDYIYSDTDSIKVINKDAHMEYIEKYNFIQRVKLCDAMNKHNLDVSLTEPVTKYGDKKLLGVWDYEGTYKRFKTLGAKRYMVETEKGISITVSGLNKKTCVPYILDKSHDKPFDYFNSDMSIPAEYTGKLTHTYIDNELRGMCVDYLGNTGEYYEKSAVHLSESPYKMGVTRELLDYISNIQEE